MSRRSRDLFTGTLMAWTGCIAVALWAADSARRPASRWPPRGRPQRIAIARDAWVSAVGDEQEGNQGGAPRFKLKGIQEMTLLDADWSALRGRRVTGALLHVKSLSPEAPALRVSVSTVATAWIEGTGHPYARQEGSVCFASPALGRAFWAYPGSTLLDAAWGRGHTLWRFADATPPDAGGWQSVAVDPDVIAANVAGLSHGLAVMDDVGSEWSERGGTFQYRLFPNRFFASREQSGAGPWLEVWTDGDDHEPPTSVRNIEAVALDLPPGQAMIRWVTPEDRGGGRVLGFHVRYDAGGGEKPVPRYLIPMAGPAGAEVRMLLQDLDLKPGQQVRLAIAAVDGSGNVGPATGHTLSVAASPPIPDLPDAGLRPFPPAIQLPDVGGLRVSVLDLLDKVEARTGRLVPDHPAGYRGGNHLWSAAGRCVRLQAARNETIGFLLNLEGRCDTVTVRLTFPPESGIRTSLFRLDCVETPAGIMPDAAVPLAGALSVPPVEDPEAAGASNVSVLCEMYVPHTAEAGVRHGTLSVSAGEDSLALEVHLRVWDFTLPDKLSFIPEMNAYGTANPTTHRDYYRLAHEHRTCLNRLYYAWSCKIYENAAPRVENGVCDWSRFDAEFGPLFDGSAFLDLPRRGEPVDVFYLPLNEDWPIPLKPHYRPSYWADEAFSSAYEEGFRAACAEFARHFNERRWTHTIFEFYLNNKVYYRRRRPPDTVPAPWVFDEPANTQDFWALRWYGMLFHQGVARHPGPARLWYRCDISRTEFSRNILWGVLDIEVMGGTTPQKARMKQDERRFGQGSYHMEYGGANAPSEANTQPVLWSLLAWSRGAVGVLPWQTIGTPKAWSQGEATCLFYPAPSGVVASVRLKAFTRGQQDVEYLTLLADSEGVPPWAVASVLPRFVNLAGRVRHASEADAGTLQADRADPTDFWRLRTSVGAMLSEKKCPYRRVVRPMPTLPRDRNALPDLGYVPVAPPVPSAKPEL